MSDSELSPADGSDAEDSEQLDMEEETGEELVSFPLTKKICAKGLSVLAKTGDGMNHAYVRLQVLDKQITDINILTVFVQIRYLDLSENCLKDISPLNSLTYLQTMKVDNNLLTSPRLKELPFLRMMSLAHNRLVTTEGIAHPLLHALNLNHNQIEEVSSLAENNPLLDTLELRGNRLTSFKGITGLPCLRKLCLAENAIETLEGLSTVTTVQWLHLRDNKLVSLDGLSEDLAVLQYMNLRGNSTLNRMEELSKLQCLHMLRALLLKGCGVEETEDYRIMVLSYARRLERLDKDPFIEEERVDAEEKYETRRKLEAEKAEAEKLEAGESIEGANGENADEGGGEGKGEGEGEDGAE